MVSMAPEKTDVDVYIYDTITGEKTLKDTITVPAGTKFYNNQGFCHTEISRDSGLIGYRKNASGNSEVVYKANGDTFQMNKASVPTSLTMGTVEIKVVSLSGHNGIAFVKK
jgi:hypothetical protein